ncbi:uncharacterized protein LOC116338108 [Contarinia nasturtii]|uniref:uncharacterized protein LOC116338108 n=1 Tax=Contarinia nasturtii TaxID=265458 RepID=UPI0012D41F9F|nr:uncharacterized protein LOC116338108 [Contarinia nasturtii]
MDSNSRKTISKEKQEAIKRILMSKVVPRKESPNTPIIELDANFSRILQKKREEQLEASRQKLFDSTGASKFDFTIDESQTEVKSHSVGSAQIKKDAMAELENSMMFPKQTQSWNDLSDGEDSFLEMERQCKMEDKHERLMNANDTMLFDVEPPSELFDQTVNHSIVNLDETQDGTVESSPFKFNGFLRPSTIIEETSSQLDSTGKSANSQLGSSGKSATSQLSTTTKLSDDDTKSTIKECSINASNVSEESESKTKISPLREANSQANSERRGTFAFKRKNHTFFPSVNLISIDESDDSLTNDKTPTRQLINIQANVDDKDIRNINEDDQDQFNNTLERVDYILEKGKQLLEETPAKRHNHHNSLLETPLFSCKRKRMISEMASNEMLPLPKRGPLIDFSTPEVTKQVRTSKFDRNLAK